MAGKITTEGLENAVNQLSALASDSSGRAARTEELFAKSQRGTISDDERAELMKSLAGGSNSDLLQPMGEEPLTKSLDVSPYIRENHKAMVETLGNFADRLEKSEANEHQFRMAVAQSLVEMGELMKSQSATLEALLGQPATLVKSQGVTGAAPLAQRQSPANEGGQEERLSKSQVLAEMQAIAEEQDNLSKSGEDMSKAIATYEVSNTISRPLSEEVVSRVRSRKAA